MIIDWLQNRITVEEALIKHTPESRYAPQIPFGYLNFAWRRMLGKMRRGDELWEYSSPPETWHKLRGQGGMALVRNGKLVSSFTTKVN